MEGAAAGGTCPGVGVELDEVHRAELPLPGPHQTLVRVVVEARLEMST